MSQELSSAPKYQATMSRLEAIRRTSSEGTEYWTARDINLILGYPNWREFEAVMDRARAAFRNNGVDPSHHFGLTHKMVGLGSGSQRRVDDFFLSRAACYLIAMNGDPSKPEIAASQAYFTIKTRQMELLEEDDSPDLKRLAVRERVTQSFRRVSGVAKDAGVRRQAFFHDARYQGLYGGVGTRDVKRSKGLKPTDNLFDHAGALELSMHEFQMNLASDVIAKANVMSEERAISTNRQVAGHVRETVKDSGGTLPERLALEEPIKAVKKRVIGAKKIAKS